MLDYTENQIKKLEGSANYHIEYIECQTCDGLGHEEIRKIFGNGKGIRPCPMCNGTGKREIKVDNTTGHEII